jgi:flagellar biosynthesis protein
MARKPAKRAVALRYDPVREAAPRVVAKGRGLAADQIIKVARKNAVPVREDPNLVQVLSRLNLDQEIPQEVYQAVAAILAFLYKLNRPKGF